MEIAVMALVLEFLEVGINEKKTHLGNYNVDLLCLKKHSK